MKVSHIFIFLVIAIPTMAQNDISHVIDHIKSDLAPDKRTAIFYIEHRIEGNSLYLNGEVSEAKFKNVLMEVLKSKFKYKIIDEIIVLPDKKLGKKTFGIINNSVANIRSKPEHPAELATQAILGTPVKVLKSQGAWYLIQTPDSYLGWLDHDGVELLTSEEFTNWSKQPKVIYTDIYGLIKDTENNEVISDIVYGAIISLVSESDGYYIVEFPDGRRGRINKISAINYDSWLTELSFSTNSILHTAKGMIGFPYLWGGTSIKGIDCSGFTKTIFFMHGLILPRDANQQSLIGEDIQFYHEFSKVLPGDLIFFGLKLNDGKNERITHVAIYLGDKQFIHSSGRVRIDSFDKSHPNYNDYRYSTILRIKRILTPEYVEKLKITNNKFYQFK
jgi:hypothetical protein